jgi:hypothetical protein
MCESILVRAKKKLLPVPVPSRPHQYVWRVGQAVPGPGFDSLARPYQLPVLFSFDFASFMLNICSCTCRCDKSDNIYCRATYINTVCRIDSPFPIPYLRILSHKLAMLITKCCLNSCIIYFCNPIVFGKWLIIHPEHVRDVWLVVGLNGRFTALCSWGRRCSSIAPC